MTKHEWREVIDVHLNGTFELCHRLCIVRLYCYICIFYLCVDSLMPLAGLHFCVGLNFVTPLYVFFLSKHHHHLSVWPIMRDKQHGRIVNIASGEGY
jgi:NAD(P)-dependent dehydrogenase (short-subunit alcohol dehydrogenase family)